MHKLLKNKILFAATATLFAAATFLNTRDNDGSTQYSMPHMPLNEKAPIELKGGPVTPVEPIQQAPASDAEPVKVALNHTRN